MIRIILFTCQLYPAMVQDDPPNEQYVMESLLARLPKPYSVLNSFDYYYSLLT